MPNWTSDLCHVNGINMHFTRTGGGKKSIVFLHGLMTNGLCWSDLAHQLEDDYDIIMPDARGHGCSSVPDFGYSYEDHANDIAGLIEALKLSHPYVLGHSMGGMTAAVVASRKPNLLRGLILVEPTFLTAKMQREVRDSDVADQHRTMLKKTLSEIIEDGERRHPERSSAIVEIFAEARLQTSMAAFDVLTPPSPDYMCLIRHIDAPSLMVFGDKGIISSNLANEIKQTNNKFRIKQIKNAGHSVHLDQPELFAEAVKDFLESIEAHV